MIYLDNIGHMVADTLEELHKFAKELGLKRSWFQEKGSLSHYDLTTQRKRNQAQEMGAELIAYKDMPRKCRIMNAKGGIVDEKAKVSS